LETAPVNMLPPLYLITDSANFGAKRCAEVIEEILSGIPEHTLFVQMREKELSGLGQFEFARILREITGRYGAFLFINDRIDIAIAVNADGVHLGQTAITPLEARGIFNGFIGYSTHSIDEVRKANAEKADFITFGPVFETPSKLKYGKPAGTDSLRRAVKAAEMPVYAIGGIKLSNIARLAESGIRGIACISALLKSDSPAEDALGMLKKIHSL